MVLGAALLVDEVFEQYLPCFELVAARMQCAQVARKRLDMPVVLDGVVAQPLRRERACGPLLIKGCFSRLISAPSELSDATVSSGFDISSPG